MRVRVAEFDNLQGRHDEVLCARAESGFRPDGRAMTKRSYAVCDTTAGMEKGEWDIARVPSTVP